MKTKILNLIFGNGEPMLEPLWAKTVFFGNKISS